MDFWPEFLANSWGKEFVAGGFGGIAGVVSGYPLDTLRIRLQKPCNTTKKGIFPVAYYRRHFIMPPVIVIFSAVF